MIITRLAKWLEGRQVIRAKDIVALSDMCKRLAVVNETLQAQLSESATRIKDLESKALIMAIAAGEQEKLKERVGKLELATGFNRPKRIG